MSDPQSVFVSHRDLCDRFNAAGYWERAQAGELRQLLRRDGHPSPAGSGQPYCTRSQIIECLDASGQRIAVVHQYRRPNGTIGGSGRPEPKLLIEGNVWYRALRPDPQGER